MKNDTNHDLYGGQNQKTQGVKFVIVTGLVALVILGIAVWGIVFIVSNARDKAGLAQTNPPAESPASSGDTSSQEIVEVTDLNDATETTEGVSAAETPAAEDTTPQTSAPAASASSSIPRTGPEDLLPVAVILGLMTAYFGSRHLVKSRA